MITRGPILALDLGVTTGFARGVPGDVPVSGSVRLKRPTQHMSTAQANLIAFIVQEFETRPPTLVVKERVLSLGAFKQLKMSEDVVYAHAGYHAIVQGLCGRYGIHWEDAPDATVRKHFIGKSRTSDRSTTKATVLQRCKLLGYLPSNCADEDRADAVAYWDWAGATFMGRIPETLHLFGERTSA